MVGLLIFMVVCLCNRSRRARFHSRGSAIRRSIRRASLYVSSTSPLELSVSELLFNLTGGVTDLQHQPQTANSILSKQLQSSPHTRHNIKSTNLRPAPSFPPPPPPTHRGHQPARWQRCLVDQSTTEEKGKVKRKRKDVSPGETYEGPVGVDQSNTEVATVTLRSSPCGKIVPKPRSRENIGKMKNITRKHKDHAIIHRTDIGTSEHSLPGIEDSHPPHHATGQTITAWDSPCSLPLPDPPAELPSVVDSFSSTLKPPAVLDKTSVPTTHSLGSRSRQDSRGARRSQ